jgi:hypothetical protein
MPTIRPDFIPLNAQGVSAANLAKNYGLLTDTDVANANTVAGLIAAVNAKLSTVNISNEAKQFIDRITRAFQTWADIGVITDALINPLTTVAGLVGLGTAVDERLTADYTGWSPKE